MSEDLQDKWVIDCDHDSAPRHPRIRRVRPVSRDEWEDPWRHTRHAARHLGSQGYHWTRRAVFDTEREALEEVVQRGVMIARDAKDRLQGAVNVQWAAIVRLDELRREASEKSPTVTGFDLGDVLSSAIVQVWIDGKPVDMAGARVTVEPAEADAALAPLRVDREPGT